MLDFSQPHIFIISSFNILEIADNDVLEIKTLESSANCTQYNLLDVLDKSLMYNRNKRGPKMDLAPLYYTYCFLFVK